MPLTVKKEQNLIKQQDVVQYSNKGKQVHPKGCFCIQLREILQRAEKLCSHLNVFLKVTCKAR